MASDESPLGVPSPITPSSSELPYLRSPLSRRKRIRISYGDRYIPNRESVNLQAGFRLKNDSYDTLDKATNTTTPNDPELDIQRIEEANRTFSDVLRSELFGDEVPIASDAGPSPPQSSSDFKLASSVTPPRSLHSAPSTPSRNLFTFGSPSSRRTPTKQLGDVTLDIESDVFSLSPVRAQSQKILLTQRKQLRSVSKVPLRVLDAPELADDFYLNLVDWSSSNILAVGLARTVYLWNALTGTVSKLCELPMNDLVTSVAWLQEGQYLAIGSHRGVVQIWDAVAERKLRTMDGHSSRAGSLAWKSHILASGSRDKTILLRDVRAPGSFFRRLADHKQEICGLKWSDDDDKLASGGNDNKLFVWNSTSEAPLFKVTEHVAAVKAIGWSPHQRGLLASGGGSADQTIKFWNTTTGKKVNEVNTGSQVCNLVWSKNSNEIVSAHGYAMNQITIWKYPSMRQVTALLGHTCRVLYLSISPDGQTIVSGAGDETLRFWNVFGKGRPEYKEVTLFDAVPQIR
ncbi:quinon protein alcohol dehydrogenase-like superfamily [Lipomyces oligophaga]|uniref:quinon protein alcohol dehydrogenase-like superfamily n=1 Tax=Lipomyces oligophaga TaxID=45792 RepID=UPI0034CF10A2